MKRCTKCILPETFPGINFNEEGICNHCLSHERLTVKGESELEKILSKYRGKGKIADCIQTYSGGRDSSYSLLKLVKEYDMNVIAVTYDWGLMTPEAHRNWQRAKDKLDIKHIVIQPDIKKTLSHVKKNLMAWAHKPHFGMWPILTQADKQTEYQVNKIARKYKIPLILTGSSPFEKTVFKYGAFGIYESDQYKLSLVNSIKLLFRIGSEYIKNPRYLNSSFFPAFKGWFTQNISQFSGNIKWINFYEYIEWREDKVLSTIKKELNWESADDTILTWRTDDYTPPLYNYICYSMKGFTENDTFRSIQIREGRISRKKALKLVKEENRPRWKTMMNYFKILELTSKEVEYVLNSIPKSFSYPEEDYKSWIQKYEL